MIDEGRDGQKKWVARARATAVTRADKARGWVDATSRRQLTFEVAVDLRNRDRDAFASVLGSAIALRMFLFATSLVVMVIALLNLVFGDWGAANALDMGGVTGGIADQVEQATRASTGRDLGLALSGAFLAFSAGRSLTQVLAACSAGAWRLEARAAKASVRTIVAVAGTLALLIVAASGLTRLREAFGVAVATGSLALNIAVLGLGWFFVSWSLPKPTRDPGAMLPGAVIFGVGITAVQWFMHFYLPRKIANASEVMGTLGVTVATLGYFFVIGRLMAGCIVVNAVMWERFGSISEVAFSLPVVRRIPERIPRIATFFDLQQAPGSDDPGPAPQQPADLPPDAPPG